MRSAAAMICTPQPCNKNLVRWSSGSASFTPSDSLTNSSPSPTTTNVAVILSTLNAPLDSWLSPSLWFFLIHHILFINVPNLARVDHVIDVLFAIAGPPKRFVSWVISPCLAKPLFTSSEPRLTKPRVRPFYALAFCWLASPKPNKESPTPKLLYDSHS